MKRRTRKKRQARSEREVGRRVKRELGHHLRWTDEVAIRNAVLQMLRADLRIIGVMFESMSEEAKNWLETEGKKQSMGEEVGE